MRLSELERRWLSIWIHKLAAQIGKLIEFFQLLLDLICSERIRQSTVNFGSEADSIPFRAHRLSLLSDEVQLPSIASRPNLGQLLVCYFVKKVSFRFLLANPDQILRRVLRCSQWWLFGHD